MMMEPIFVAVIVFVVLLIFVAVIALSARTSSALGQDNVWDYLQGHT